MKRKFEKKRENYQSLAWAYERLEDAYKYLSQVSLDTDEDQRIVKQAIQLLESLDK